MALLSAISSKMSPRPHALLPDPRGLLAEKIVWNRDGELKGHEHFCRSEINLRHPLDGPVPSLSLLWVQPETATRNRVGLSG